MDTDILIGAVIVALFALGLLWPGIRALRGHRRLWVVKPPYLPTQISERNTWPFMLICAGLAILFMIPSIYFELMGDERMRQLWWKLPFVWIPGAGVILSFFWWPGFLAPRWYRQWLKRGGKRVVMPWSQDEIDAVEAEPEGKPRAGKLKDIEKCRYNTNTWVSMEGDKND
ncbi:hypothetical protein GCM10027591_01370 [Zhihengliuella somnathii]